MSISAQSPRVRQQGLVLVTSLLLLVVVTLLAVSMFRSFGLDERIAGNTREKGRALHAAEVAEQYSEYWLANGHSGTGITCNSVVPAATGQVCSNPLPTNVAGSVTSLPWKIGANLVGVTYSPTAPTSMNITTGGGLGANSQGVYYTTPSFYISYLGASPTGLGSVFMIDAVGYGGSADTAAVVETTYLVQNTVRDLGGQ